MQGLGAVAPPRMQTSISPGSASQLSNAAPQPLSGVSHGTMSCQLVCMWTLIPSSLGNPGEEPTPHIWARTEPSEVLGRTVEAYATRGVGVSPLQVIPRPRKLEAASPRGGRRKAHWRLSMSFPGYLAAKASFLGVRGIVQARIWIEGNPRPHKDSAATGDPRSQARREWRFFRPEATYTAASFDMRSPILSDSQGATTSPPPKSACALVPVEGLPTLFCKY